MQSCGFVYTTWSGHWDPYLLDRFTHRRGATEAGARDVAIDRRTASFWVGELVKEVRDTPGGDVVVLYVVRDIQEHKHIFVQQQSQEA